MKDKPHGFLQRKSEKVLNHNVNVHQKHMANSFFPGFIIVSTIASSSALLSLSRVAIRGYCWNGRRWWEKDFAYLVGASRNLMKRLQRLPQHVFE